MAVISESKLLPSHHTQASTTLIPSSKMVQPHPTNSQPRTTSLSESTIEMIDSRLEWISDVLEPLETLQSEHRRDEVLHAFEILQLALGLMGIR